jgi:hypothetical protein
MYLATKQRRVRTRQPAPPTDWAVSQNAMTLNFVVEVQR